MSMIGILIPFNEKQKQNADVSLEEYSETIFHGDRFVLENWWNYLWFVFDVWFKKENINLPNPVIQLNENIYLVGEDLGYGKPNYLPSEIVQKIYATILELKCSDLVTFAITQKIRDMYPRPWPEDLEREPDFIDAYFARVIDAYRLAAEQNYGMLQAII